MAKHQYYDISLPLNQDIRILPELRTGPAQATENKTTVSRVFRFFDVDKGDKVTMSRLELDSHDGTHIDAPLHFIPGGMTIDRMPVETTNGPCRVIEIKDKSDITIKELEPYKIKAGERILFKTGNSPHVYNVRQYTGPYCAVIPETAKYLVEKKVLIVGLDYLTVAHSDRPDNISAVHRAFLGAGIFILEAINLDGVPAGKYEMMCLPIRIENGDAAPCRVILKK